jgi:hypothetical protein
MRTIRFSSGKLVIATIAGFGMLFLGLPMMLAGPLGVILGLIIVIGGPIFAIASIMRLLGDGVALQFDRQSVSIASGWSTKSYNWSDIKDIQITRQVLRMYGIIPVSSQNFIDFHLVGGLFGTKKIRLPVKTLQLKKDELPQLYSELMLAKAGQEIASAPHMSASALSQPQPVPQVSGSAPSWTFSASRDALEGAPRSADFNPDEVMARYMSRRAQEQEAITQTQDAQTPATMPARPSFGRKVA